MIHRINGRWSNAAEDRISIVPYDPSWPKMFADEVAVIRKAVPAGTEFRAVHVGSTAVPGLAAKPIIDIMLLVPDRDDWASFVEPLESLEYVFWSDNPKRERMFFVKGMPPFGRRRTHHVHIREKDDIDDALTFRDYLRSNPKEAKRYETLKKELSCRYEADREEYTAAKASFVEEVLRRVRGLE